jgi:D-glycero-D-manno-heptose 1,7-bisphosphate phosphatase
LNKNPGPGKYVRSWAEWEWLPGAKEALGLFHEAGYRVVIITNQSGIAQGLLTEDALSNIHRNMKESTKAEGGDNITIYYCPHIQANSCECRKPKPGMLLQAQRDLSFDFENTYFIGDDERDRQAGEAVGCPSIIVNNEVGLLEVTRQIVSGAVYS